MTHRNSSRTFRLAGLGLFAAASLFLGGCNGDAGARRIDEREAITTVGQIDIQDFNHAARELTNKMLVSAQFQNELRRLNEARPRGPAPLVKISRIKNDTTLKMNMRGFLVDPMEEVLSESGKVRFFAEDTQAQGIAAAHETLGGGGPQIPDLVLYGTVRDLRTEAGSMRQAAYIFHLRLAGADGTTVWQGQTQIIKRGSRPAVGL